MGIAHWCTCCFSLRFFLLLRGTTAVFVYTLLVTDGPGPVRKTSVKTKPHHLERAYDEW